MRLEAPAKINLTLRVLRRREDGFHEIESLVAPISLYDSLEITSGTEAGVEFQCDDPTLPRDETNLVVRAAKLFYNFSKIPPKTHISLQKRIPHGAGLGGGSSDAAATLLGLDRWHGASLGLDALTALAAELGSDVPLFLTGSPAWIRGRGECVTPVTLPSPIPLLLIKPPFGVPTPWAYQQWADSPEIPGVPYAAQDFPWGSLVNDLERPVFAKYLLLAHLKQWLLKQPEPAGALMSGSGATVFALLRDAEGAAPLASRLRETFGSDLWSCPVETLDRRAG